MKRRCARMAALAVALVILVGCGDGVGIGSFPAASTYHITYSVEPPAGGFAVMWLPVPTELDNIAGLSDVTVTEIYGGGTLYETTGDNQVIYFTNLAAGGTYGYQIEATIDSVNIAINADTVTDPPASVAGYLEATTLAQSENAAIVQRSAQIVGDQTNPYSKASAIATWINANIQFQTGGNHDAVSTLNAGTAQCSGFANLFVALCRSADVPARIVAGALSRGYDTLQSGQWTVSESLLFHVWAEAYIAPYGWVPFDQTLNFGQLPEHRLPLSRGGDIYLPNGGASKEWFHLPAYEYGQYEGAGVSLTFERID